MATAEAPTAPDVAAAVAVSPNASAKTRLFVLTDIGGDPDDRMSMVRLMTYANQFDIEGLVATRNRGGLFPEQIASVVNAYGSVRDNLALHEPGYPEAQTLLGRIATGSPDGGMRRRRGGEGHHRLGTPHPYGRQRR